MMLKTYTRAALRRAANKRGDGYYAAVLAAAKASTPDTVTLDAKDAARITREYGGGVPVTRKVRAGCAGCGSGKAKLAASVADETWHKAINQTEGQ